MKRQLLLVCAACVLVLLAHVFDLAQTGRGRGQVCADGYASNVDTAEQEAVQAAQAQCVKLGGTPQGTVIEYSGCGLLNCRATACTKCLIPGLPPPQLMPLRR
jgi:hypothetical protein